MIKINIPDKKLKTALDSDRECQKRFGTDVAKKLKIRLGLLGASETLAALWPPMKLPERCHALAGDRLGQFSIDLKHPFRLIFRATDEKLRLPVADERTRWQSIKEIDVLEIEDTHG